jgi:hypothetical protein
MTEKIKHKEVIMSEPQHFEVRTDDNRLFCMARLIEGDILLILKSAGKEIHIPYTDIPRLVAMARKRKIGQAR